MDRKTFINTYSDLVIESCNKNKGLFASVKMAQMVVETNSGKSYLFIECNNAFGIKADNSWTGAVCYANDDKPNEAFRKYYSVLESINDHSDFLKTNPRYNAVFTATTPEQQAYELKAAKYATAHNYATMLISIISQNNLKDLDKQLISQTTNVPNSTTSVYASNDWIIVPIFIIITLISSYFIYKSLKVNNEQSIKGNSI